MRTWLYHWEDCPEGQIFDIEHEELEALQADGWKDEPGPTKAEEEEPVSEDEVNDILANISDQQLREVLEDAGVKVDGRWGRARLLAEYEGLRHGNGTDAD